MEFIFTLIVFFTIYIVIPFCLIMFINTFCNFITGYNNIWVRDLYAYIEDGIADFYKKQQQKKRDKYYAVMDGITNDMIYEIAIEKHNNLNIKESKRSIITKEDINQYKLKHIK